MIPRSLFKKIIQHPNQKVKRFLIKKLDSDRDTSLDPRTLVTNALESVAVTEDEKTFLKAYKDQIDILNKQTKRLAEIKAEIKDISFGKARTEANFRGLRKAHGSLRGLYPRRTNDFSKRLTFKEIPKEDDVDVKVITGTVKTKNATAALALRSEPSTQTGTRFFYIPKGKKVSIIAEAVTEANGYTWDCVIAEYGGKEYIGYSAAEFLK